MYQYEMIPFYRQYKKMIPFYRLLLIIISLSINDLLIFNLFHV